MPAPLVSVITNPRRGPHFLRSRSIPSVLRQIHANWELIVVVGSGDEWLGELVASYRDGRMQAVGADPAAQVGCPAEARARVAAGSAHNRGLETARGEIVAVLEDGDEFLPGHIADCVEALRERDADLVYGKVIVRDIETGIERDEYQPWDETARCALLDGRSAISPSSVCYSRRLAELRCAEDGATPPLEGLWGSILAAGGEFTSVESPQAIRYGEEGSRIRLAMPSLPPLEEFQAAVADLFRSRRLSNSGAWCRRLETAVAERAGTPFGIATPSADIGLTLVLRSLAARSPGRKGVVLPSYTFPSTANAVLAAGLEPVFCDVDASSLCVDPEAARSLVDEGTAAILAVHAHGNPADMPALERIAASAGVVLLADAASAFGARIGGRSVGSFGDVSVFSFSGTKILTAGEGGVICCADAEFARSLRLLGRYGLGDDYVCESVGLNGKLAELPAALALLGLPRLDGWLARRSRAVEAFRQRLEGLPALRLQRPYPGARSTWAEFAVVFPSPEVARRVEEVTDAYGIDTRPYYKPLHRMPAFTGCARGPLERTEAVADRVVCLPMYNEIRDETVALIAEVVREAVA
jgi:dTDP-4-amino-4,6-dideoxygalactose transaminase